jgi:dihydrofolate reductase
MKLTVSTFVTLDGVMEDPGGAEGFEHGGWQIPFFDEAMGAAVTEGLFAAEALLLGRRTYEAFAAAWPGMERDEAGFADRMNEIPKHVASRTLGEATWNASIIQGGVPEAVGALRRQDGGSLLVMGSADLVRTLREHSLVDEYQLFVHPVVVGSGKRLFDGGPRTSLRLVDSKTTGTGVTIATYVPAESG